jgi:phosphate transport system protein
MKKLHASAEFELDLREIRGQVVAMGARCERAVRLAIEGFLERDASKTLTVATLESRVNRDEMEIDEMAVRLLALRQPVAHDLRFIMSTLKLVTDLERIADEALNIAERTETVAGAIVHAPVFGIPKMGELVERMLGEALGAFVDGDAERARGVIATDEQVDALHRDTLHETLAWMAGHPKEIPNAMCVASVAKYLERIADHATNLAEHVVFLEKGEDVRHRLRRGRLAH